MIPERLYPWLVLSSSAAMVGGAIAMLILMLATVIGPFRFGGLAVHEASRAVGMWVPPRPWGGGTGKRVHAWREVVPRGEVVVERESLVGLIRDGVRVVVVPDPRQLVPGEVEQINRFVRGGGAVVLSGAVAVREPTGDWRGFDAMRELLRVERIETVQMDRSNRLVPVRRGPLVARLEPDAAIVVRPEPGVPALPGDGDEELRWGGGGRLAAARRLDLGTGRLVWLGPGPEAELREERTPFLELHRNALAWARRLPRVERLPWPGGRPFAVALAPDERRPAAGALARIERAARRGALVKLQLPLGPGSLPLRERLLARARERGAWLTDPALLEEWRAARKEVFVRLESVTERRLLLRVTNDGPRPVSDLVVRVYVNQPIERISVESAEILVDPAAVGFQRGNEWADVALPGMPPNVNRGFYLDYELPEI